MARFSFLEKSFKMIIQNEIILFHFQKCFIDSVGGKGEEVLVKYALLTINSSQGSNVGNEMRLKKKKKESQEMVIKILKI